MTIVVLPMARRRAPTRVPPMNGLGRLVLNSRARRLAQRRLVLPTMERISGDLRDARVLEIGCGCGQGAELLLERTWARRVMAIDIDAAMVRHARRRLDPRAGVVRADMVELGAATAAFDAVVDFGALHIEPRWRDALDEVLRVLRPGGVLLFEEIVRPRRQRLSGAATTGRPPRDFTAAALVGALDRRGFSVNGCASSWRWTWTGLAGDIVGVARAPATVA